MQVVEKDAKEFGNHFIRQAGTLKFAKEKIDLKLFNYLLEKDRIYFLRTARKQVEETYNEHKKTCTNSNCPIDKQFSIAVFAIDQEMQSIEKFYTPEITTGDEFTIQEKVDIHTKLNQIIEELNKQGIGQEIIFNEIDELKEHFNLGKKNWQKLLKGKLIDIGIEFGIEKTIIEPIYNSLCEGLNPLKKILE